jgi:thiaminase
MLASTAPSSANSLLAATLTMHTYYSEIWQHLFHSHPRAKALLVSSPDRALIHTIVSRIQLRNDNNSSSTWISEHRIKEIQEQIKSDKLQLNAFSTWFNNAHRFVLNPHFYVKCHLETHYISPEFENNNIANDTDNFQQPALQSLQNSYFVNITIQCYA